MGKVFFFCLGLLCTSHVKVVCFSTAVNKNLVVYLYLDPGTGKASRRVLFQVLAKIMFFNSKVFFSCL